MQDSTAKVRYLNRRLDSLNAALTRFHDSRERLTPGGQDLLDWSLAHLHDIRADLEHQVERSEQVRDSERRDERRVVTVNAVAASTEEFANFVLPALNGARSDRVPVEIEPFVQRLAQGADPRREVTVVLYGADVVEYATQFPPDYHDRPADETTDLLPDDEPSTSFPEPVAIPPSDPEIPVNPKRRFVSVRIPAIERDSGTMHSLALGHELGHLRVMGYDLGKLIKNPPPSDWQVPERPHAVGVDAHLEVFTIYAAFVEQWGHEILADMIAVKVLGPAALLAFGELVGTRGDWHHDSATHPGSDRRCALMLRLLERGGFFEFDELRPVLDHYSELCADAVTRPVFMHKSQIKDGQNSPRQRAWDAITRQLDQIVEAAVGSVDPDDRFTPDDFKLALRGQDVLAAGRPFAEQVAALTASDAGEGTPDDDDGLLPIPIPTILNAAWLAKINRRHDLAACIGADADDDNDYARICAVLDGLVLKSIEISEFQRGRP